MAEAHQTTARVPDGDLRDCGGVFHRRVVQPLFDAGYVWPKAGNLLFWIVGCMGHGANEFVLTPEGYDALVGQLPLPL